CPRDLEFRAKLLHCNMTAWMYLLDDGLCQLSEEADGQPWYQDYVRALIQFHEQCWLAAMSAQPRPMRPDPMINISPGPWRSRPSDLFQLGHMLYKCGLELRDIAPFDWPLSRLVADVYPLTAELRSSLSAKIDEAT